MVHLIRQLNKETGVVEVSKQSVPDMPYASYAELKHAERVELGRVIRSIINRWHRYEFMV